MKSDVLRRFESFLATPELPSLGPKPRASREPAVQLNRKLDDAFAETKIEPSKQLLISSLVLLWHDHLDESHSLSQEIHGADGSVLHGIMHRREPDCSNAKYWFHRVGFHPAFPLIAERTGELLKAKGEGELENQLLPTGKWNADLFVDACQRSARGTAASVETLQQVQAIEFQTLLEHFCKETQ